MSWIESEAALAEFDSSVRRKRNNTGQIGSGRSSPRDRISSMVSGGAEVMVKVVSYGHGTASVQRQMAYISRDGELELETERGEVLTESNEVREYFGAWQASIDTEPAYTPRGDAKGRRDTMHMVLAMPHSGDEANFRVAVRSLARHSFGHHEFVIAVHTPENDEDTKYSHAHLLVKMRGMDGTRLNPRKADLQIWREEYATELRQVGMDVQATPRVVRSVLTRGEGQGIVQGRARLAEAGQLLGVDAKHQREAVDQILAQDRGGAAPAEQPAVAQARQRITDTRAALARLADTLGQEQPNERPDYDRISASAAARVWQRAALDQSHFESTPRKAAAAAIAGLRDLPRWHVVRERTAEVLLHAHAPDRLGHRAAAGEGVRRAGAGVDRAQRAAGRSRGVIGERAPGDAARSQVLAGNIRAFLERTSGHAASAAEKARSVLRQRFKAEPERNQDVQRTVHGPTEQSNGGRKADLEP